LTFSSSILGKATGFIQTENLEENRPAISGNQRDARFYYSNKIIQLERLLQKENFKN
jgi:hypothetical protein